MKNSSDTVDRRYATMEMNHEKLKHWTDLIEQWSESGLSAKAWCEQEHLTYPTFCYWRRKLQELQETGTQPDVKVACFRLECATRPESKGG